MANFRTALFFLLSCIVALPTQAQTASSMPLPPPPVSQPDEAPANTNAEPQLPKIDVPAMQQPDQTQPKDTSGKAAPSLPVVSSPLPERDAEENTSEEENKVSDLSSYPVSPFLAIAMQASMALSPVPPNLPAKTQHKIAHEAQAQAQPQPINTTPPVVNTQVTPTVPVKVVSPAPVQTSRTIPTTVNQIPAAALDLPPPATSSLPVQPGETDRPAKVALAMPASQPATTAPVVVEPFSIYDRKNKGRPPVKQVVTVVAPPEKDVEALNAIQSILDDQKIINEQEADAVLGFGNLLLESPEEQLARLNKEREEQKRQEIAALQARAHLNYKIQNLPESIYNDHYTRENRHLPDPRYTSEYKKWAFKAINNNSLDDLRTMLDSNNIIEATNDNDDTLLIYATKERRMDLVRFLLARDANPNAINNNRATALHVAAYTGQLQVAESLLEMGAEVNRQDRLGYTPLILATMYRHPDIVKLLLHYHANTALKDNQGRTAYDIAVANGDMELADLLKPAVTPLPRYNEPIYITDLTPKHHKKKRVVHHTHKVVHHKAVHKVVHKRKKRPVATSVTCPPIPAQ